MMMFLRLTYFFQQKTLIFLVEAGTGTGGYVKY